MGAQNYSGPDLAELGGNCLLKATWQCDAEEWSGPRGLLEYRFKGYMKNIHGIHQYNEPFLWVNFSIAGMEAAKWRARTSNQQHLP